MADTGSYASGNWHVKQGNEDQFVARWTEFLEWTRDNVSGFQGANLIRQTDDPAHFVSFAQWDDDESQQGWRAEPEFQGKIGACVELCDDFQGASYTRAASV
jgi:heme-degrading monooxygenase HmoA